MMKKFKITEMDIREMLNDLIKLEINRQIQEIKVEKIAKAFADQFHSQRLVKEYLIPGIRKDLEDFYSNTLKFLEERLERSAGSFDEWRKMQTDFRVIKSELAEMKEIIGIHIIKPKK